MILYHGTNIDFAEIDLTLSKVGKDFGVGFYLTPEKEVALRQAERKYHQSGIGGKYVLPYEWVEQAGLKVLKFDSYALQWAEFILLNRKNKTREQLHDYDVVIGPIADDTVGFQIRRLEDGIISMSQFLEEIKYHQVTMQYFFATPQSLATLKRL